jgi:hypothetical protein
MLSEAKRDILVLGYSHDTCKEETAVHQRCGIRAYLLATLKESQTSMLSEAKRDALVLGYSLDTCKEETAVHQRCGIRAYSLATLKERLRH